MDIVWPISEDRLFERFRRRREVASLAQVFDRVAPALLRVASHLCQDADVAEDLVQQTFLTAIERAERWDPERGLFPWLVGILTNRARLHRRAEQRTPVAERLSQPAVEQPDDAAERRELEAAVDAAIAELGDTYRPVLHLHLLHGLNAKEIAAALGRPAGSVRTQLVRGLERLRATLPVGLGVALASSGALMAMRQRVLDAVPTAGIAGTGSATAVATAASWMIGGAMAKKWLLAAVALLLGAFVIWPSARPPAAPAPFAEDVNRPAIASADVDGAAETAGVDGASEVVSRTLAGPASGAEVMTASIEVRCTAALALPDGTAVERALPGVWVRLRRPGESGLDRRLGADCDAAGVARFERLPPGEWEVVAGLGVVQQTAVVALDPGGSHVVALAFESITGVDVIVVDEVNRPVAEAEIWVAFGFDFGRVRPMEVTTRLAGRTDSSGRARVAAGSVAHISARKAGYSASLAGRAEFASTGPLTLILRRGGGTIAGAVRDERGRAVAAARVFLWPALEGDGGSFRTEDGSPGLPPAGIRVNVDERGEFVVDGLAAGRYRGVATAPAALDADLEVDVRDGERSVASFVLHGSVRLGGVVVRRDGQPAPGLHVVGNHLGGERVKWASSRTGEDGRFTIEVPRSGYHLEIRRRDQVLAEARSAAPVTGPVELRLTVDEHRLASGRVVDERGEPVADWFVVAMPDGEHTDHDVMRAADRARTQTDSDGRFELWGSEVGRLTIAALARLGGRYRQEAPPQRQGVLSGSVGIELVVPDRWQNGATVVAHVVDDTGLPVQNLDATLMTQSDSEVTCEAGRVRCASVMYGSQRLQLTATGYGTVSIKTVVDRPLTDLGEIVLQRAVELRVRPQLPVGQPWRGPLPRPWIKHLDGGSVAGQKMRVEDGAFVFSCLPPGRYRIVPHFRDNVAANPLPFDLRQDAPLTLGWPVQIGRRVALDFAEDPAAPIDPEVPLTITVWNARGEVALQETQERGSNPGWLLLKPLALGKHRVTATCQNGLAYEGEFDVELGGDTPRFTFQPRR